MLRLVPSLLIPRRHAATIVAFVLAAQLSLFAHAVGHDYFQDADHGHVVCGLCIAAQHLDYGLTSADIRLPHAAVDFFPSEAHRLGVTRHACALFEARAPPVTLPH